MEGFLIKTQKANLLFVILISFILFASCNADNTAKNEEKDNQSNIIPTVFVKNEKEQVPRAEDINNGSKEKETKTETEKNTEKEEKQEEEESVNEDIPPTLPENAQKTEEKSNFGKGIKIIFSLFDEGFADRLALDYKNYIMAKEQETIHTPITMYNSGMLKNLKDGEYDVFISSNSLKENEKKLGLKDEVIAYEVGAVVVNHSNPVKDITTKQLSEILNGTIKNWSEIGGNDIEIKALYSMKDLETKELLAELIGFNVEEDGKIVQKQILEAVPADTDISLIKKVGEDPSAIGIITPRAGNSEVRLLNLNGVVPSRENIINGSYMFQKAYRVYSSELNSEYAKKFFEYLKSDECKKELAMNYFLF